MQINGFCEMCGQDSTFRFEFKLSVCQITCNTCNTLISQGAPAKARYDAEIAKAQKETIPRPQRAGRIARESKPTVEHQGLTLAQQKMMIRDMKAAVKVMQFAWTYMVERRVQDGIMTYEDAIKEFHARTDFYEQQLTN